MCLNKILAKPLGYTWKESNTGRSGFINRNSVESGWAQQNPTLNITSAVYSLEQVKEIVKLYDKNSKCCDDYASIMFKLNLPRGHV